MEIFLPFSAACKATRDFPGCLRARFCQPAANRRERGFCPACLLQHPPALDSASKSFSVQTVLRQPRSFPASPWSWRTAEIHGQFHPSFCLASGEREGEERCKHSMLEWKDREGKQNLHTLYIPTSTSFHKRIPGG